MNAQDAANNILVDLDAESQRDLLSNARTAPAGIAPFHYNNGVNEIFLRSLRTRRCLRSDENNKRYFRLLSTAVEMQQSGRLQNDGGTKSACPGHEKSAQAGDDTICSAQIGRTLSTTIQNQQLMPDQHGFGNEGAESAGFYQVGP